MVWFMHVADRGGHRADNKGKDDQILLEKTQNKTERVVGDLKNMSSVNVGPAHLRQISQ